MLHTRTRALALAAVLALPLTSCTWLSGGDDETTAPAPPPAADQGQGETEDATATATGPANTDPGTVVLLTHDSFTLPDELIAQFEAQSGYELDVQLSGDAGELTNQIVLTAGRPVGDAVFGIDNTFASRAISGEALAPYTSDNLPESAEEHLLEGGDAAYLTPVDYGDVCINIDEVWFANNGILPPETLDDLIKPEYEDLFVTPGASTSSPGMAFLLATIGHYGPGEWQPYWEDLMANGTKVTSGWTDAYTVDFTAGGGNGDRPIVLSYSSSPPFTIAEGYWQPSTRALLETCFRQVEYAGVLEGAGNPDGAEALIDWLVSPEVQAVIPDNMFMYPVSDEVMLPELWAQWAPLSEEPIVVPPRQIEEERETWLQEWADIATG